MRPAQRRTWPDRDLAADGPNRPRVADAAGVPTATGLPRPAVVLDAFSQRVVGRAVADRPRAEPVPDAPEAAVGQRRPDDVIHRSDRGRQRALLAPGERCKEAGVRPSTGPTGGARDGARGGSPLATPERERRDRRRSAPRVKARAAVLSLVEGWCDPFRRRSAASHQPPVACED